MMPRDAVSHAAMHLIDVVFLARTSLKKKKKKLLSKSFACSGGRVKTCAFIDH